MRIFENRVMSQIQIRKEIFPDITPKVVSKRLYKLAKHQYLQWGVARNENSRITTTYLNTPNALKAISDCYPHKITSPLCKSESIGHDLQLVNLRSCLEAKKCVTGYYTENMLQACEHFTKSEVINPFVRNNTDAVLEIEKNGKKAIIGLEFENSEKASERYTRKLLSYYSDSRVPVVLYICSTPRIQKVIAQVESEIVAKNRPRCFYALSENVLAAKDYCTFVNLSGEKVTLQ